jgi:hypothetical protein
MISSSIHDTRHTLNALLIAINNANVTGEEKETLITYCQEFLLNNSGNRQMPMYHKHRMSASIGMLIMIQSGLIALDYYFKNPKTMMT